MRSPVHRLGALGLGLLLQVFVFSGFLHPCCLGEAHGANTAQIGAAAEMEGGHGSAHGHGPAGHDAASQSSGDVDTSAGHSSSHNSCEGCESDACGLCCQSVGAALAASSIRTGHLLDGASHFAAPPSLVPSHGTPAPAFLLPFANGPPLSPVANG